LNKHLVASKLPELQTDVHEQQSIPTSSSMYGEGTSPLVVRLASEPRRAGIPAQSLFPASLEKPPSLERPDWNYNSKPLHAKLSTFTNQFHHKAGITLRTEGFSGDSLKMLRSVKEAGEVSSLYIHMNERGFKVPLQVNNERLWQVNFLHHGYKTWVTISQADNIRLEKRMREQILPQLRKAGKKAQNSRNLAEENIEEYVADCSQVREVCLVGCYLLIRPVRSSCKLLYSDKNFISMGYFSPRSQPSTRRSGRACS
jgi:hypothetical protein